MKKSGFTLIELILAILLIGIIAGFIGGILLQETNMYSLIATRKEANIESKLVMERILKEVRYGYANEFNSGNNVRIKIYDTQKGYSSVNFYLQNNKLYLKTNNGVPDIVADNVTFFNITAVRANYSNYTSKLRTRNLVRVRLSLKKENQDVNYETNVFLRNKR